ncbi:MAG: hypothetical protein IPG42_00895 [Betaproteobacteria bacterium]|jgi:hypothetical protein|nr:hypothetical protein [Betaproteobacteria bacterium]MBK7657071.1 hypothetical protein [Betaproteobacteria bacterium]MBP6645298.1 hypothetical protein [Burkholderiaceae bacterium]
MSNQQTHDTRDMKDDVSELPVPSQFDEFEDQAKEFVRSHFGNPESGEVYGVGNDYESEEDQVKQEKASAGQAIWIIGSLLLLTAIGYWVIR